MWIYINIVKGAGQAIYRCKVSDKQVKAGLKQVLEQRGFEVEMIQETHESRPDLIATDGSSQFLIEVKERFGEDYQMAGESYVRLDKIARKNRLSGIVQNAVKQLATRRTDQTFNLLWLVADPLDRKLHYEQLRATVFGIRIVIGKLGGQGIAKECYYATHSDFFRWREILDGVALGNYGGMFINDHSPQYYALRTTRLLELFRPAVWDPLELESQGDALRLDSNVDRSDEDSVKKAIHKQYGIDVISFESLTRFSV
jgi:hypothetical protein